MIAVCGAVGFDRPHYFRNEVFNPRAETKCARAVGIGLPERSEPEGPQGAARRRDFLRLVGSLS